MKSQLKSQQAIFWLLTDSKIYMKSQKTQNRKRNIKGEKQSQKTDVLDLKTYHKAIAVKRVWYWGKKSRQMEQNREHRNRHNRYNQLILDKGERQPNGEKSFFQQMMLEQLNTHKQKLKRF